MRWREDQIQHINGYTLRPVIMLTDQGGGLDLCLISSLLALQLKLGVSFIENNREQVLSISLSGTSPLRNNPLLLLLLHVGSFFQKSAALFHHSH